MRFFVSVVGTASGLRTLPGLAPTEAFETQAVWRVAHLDLNFETDPDWQVSGDAAAGHWERGVPAGGPYRGAPSADFDGSGHCYLTGNAPGDSDVDAGTTILTSAPYSIAGLADPHLAYARWYSNHTGAYPESDVMVVEVSADGGASWITLETVGPTGPEVRGGWYLRDFALRDYVGSVPQFTVRYRVSDLGGGSVIEAAVDAVTVYELTCTPDPRQRPEE